jgi:tRNA pseudouridine55 synthase
MPARAAAIDGVVLLDKPKDLTSNAALQRVRRLYGRPKAGHTGTLDPLATGLLPICLGQATKFSEALLGADKHYETTVRLGFYSSTGDAEGKLEPVADPRFDDALLERALRELTGRIEQVPPMHSALKVDGQPLYRSARKGETVERRVWTVEIRELRLVSRVADRLQLAVTCSKGTYIRVLAEDLGRKLGCGGYVLELRRTHIGSFSIESAVTLPRLEALEPGQRNVLVLPVDALLDPLPRVDLDAEAAQRLSRGQSTKVSGSTPGRVRLYGRDGYFLGVGEADAEGIVVPRRLLAAVQNVVSPQGKL